ncbi:MAG: HPP family protein [Dehalococcoidia bacterium]
MRPTLSGYRSGLIGDLLLAAPPTLTVLGSVFLLQLFRHQRILFASLASSAFLVYREPAHPMDGIRQTIPAHLIGVGLGVGAALLLHPGYIAGAVAMTSTILVLVLLRIVHPPAISTALGFAFSQTRIGPPASSCWRW